MQVIFYPNYRHYEHPTICHDESIISSCNASAATDAKRNGDVPSTTMDAISVKNKNGIKYA